MGLLFEPQNGTELPKGKYATRYRIIGENEAFEVEDLRKIKGESALVMPVFIDSENLDFRRSQVYERDLSKENETPWKEMIAGTERGRILRKYQAQLSENPKEAVA